MDARIETGVRIEKGEALQTTKGRTKMQTGKKSGFKGNLAEGMEEWLNNEDQPTLASMRSELYLYLQTRAGDCVKEYIPSRAEVDEFMTLLIERSKAADGPMLLAKVAIDLFCRGNMDNYYHAVRRFHAEGRND